MLDPGLLARGVHAAQRLQQRVEVYPAPFIRWLPPQQALFECDARRKLLRTGNQFGKTWAGLQELWWRVTGTHPFLRTRKPPITAWVVCHSWQQSQEIMCKLYDLADKRMIHPRDLARFKFAEGWPARNPTIRLLNGSVIKFKTVGQDRRALASGTVHFILIDEPADESAYSELERRLTRTGGTLVLTLTPADSPVEYLRRLCEQGTVRDLHFKFAAHNFVPVGYDYAMRLEDGTPMAAEWVAEQRGSVLEHVAPIVLDGEWETRAEGAVFRRFSKGEHVRQQWPIDQHGSELDLRICIGIDHGSRAFKQTILLVGIQDPHRLDPFAKPGVHVLAEYCDDEGTSTPEQDAEGLLSLLDLYGWRYGIEGRGGNLFEVRGDIPHNAGRIRGPIGDKSNAELQAELARALSKRTGRKVKPAAVRPAIKRVKTGAGGSAGSVYRGCTWLHRAMLRPGKFSVHPRCERLIEALETWDGTATTEDHKDPIDALRYATWRWAMRGHFGTGASSLRMALG